MISSARIEFVRFLVSAGALRFGDFTTKSGRRTPYFINTGEFRNGSTLLRLSEFYADAIRENFGPRAQNLYGPAYKGIPLCAAAGMSLYRRHGQDPTITYNRKEAKDHGEGGLLVGDIYTKPTKIVIVEDVITAGTSVRETLDLLSKNPNARPVGLVVSVDRKEKLASGRSALQEVEKEFGLKAVAICDIDDILTYVSDPSISGGTGLPEGIAGLIRDYRNQWGA